MEWRAARALLIVADRDGGDSRSLSRRAEAGALVRIRRGVYAKTALWRRLRGEERLQLRMLALVLTARSRPVFSHWAAALLHGLPVPHRMCDRVDLAMDTSRDRAVAGARAHLLRLDGTEVVEIEGMLCTSLVRTAVDVAADSGFEDAVVVADAALARVGDDGRTRLADAADLSDRRRGLARFARVLEFADPRSASPGESISRVRMDRLGFIRPELQFLIETDGHRDFGDFGWEEVLAIGEFDGEVKYRDDRYRRGGEVEGVVIREKNRENRMRRRRPRFARWDWSDLQEGRLEGILRDIGIPKRREDGEAA